MSELRQRGAGGPHHRPTLRLVEAAAATTSASARVDTALSGLMWTSRYRHILRATDAAIVMASVGLVLIVIAINGAGQVSPLLAYGVIPGTIVAVWLASLALFQTRESHILAVGATEYKRVLNASALALGMLAVGFIVFPLDFARGYLVIGLPLGTAALLVGRWICRRWLLRQRRFGHYLSRALVVGKRADVDYVIQKIDEKSAGYFVVGIAVDDSPTPELTIRQRRIPVVAGLSSAAQAAATLLADTVIVAGDPTSEPTFIRDLSWKLEGTATELVLSSRLTDVAGPRIHFRPVEGLPLIHVEIPTFDGWRHAYKRAFDVAFSTSALLLLAPVLVLIAIWVRLDSPGPVLFRQERCGRNGEKFEMLKFRSMVATAERDLAGLLDLSEGNGVLFKMRNDPRVTAAGRWLRKYSLDELPQLWNVLIGDMSIVGPRPPLQSEADGYEDDVRRRLFIKPGLTGLWQISGRSDLSWEESVRLDLYYVENWSLTGDFMIIWRTFNTIVRPVGAY